MTSSLCLFILDEGQGAGIEDLTLEDQRFVDRLSLIPACCILGPAILLVKMADLLSSPLEKYGGSWLIGGAAPEKVRDVSNYPTMV